MSDTLFMQRCLSLAQKGLGYTYPNPLVGCVIVHDGKIIAEGWHKKAGKNHAEREAIFNVKDSSLLSQSTLYVNLEPCDHFGKTPPCSDLIIEKKIPRVVIGCLDENKKVWGKGLKKLQNAGCEVQTGVLEDDCQKLNRRFFSFHQKKQPYVILKWAESADGFIAPKNTNTPYWLTNPLSKQRVHQWRSHEQSVMIGVKTAIIDDPSLTTRLWSGNNPQPVVIDPNHKISNSQIKLKSIDNRLINIVRNKKAGTEEHLTAKAILDRLYDEKIQSVIIEGGTHTLQHFIDAALWDEARIFVTTKNLKEGLKAPKINRERFRSLTKMGSDRLIWLYKD